MEEKLNVEIKTKLVKAAMGDKWEDMLEILEKQEKSLTSPITVIGDTAIHYIVQSGREDLVQKVIENLLKEHPSSSSPLLHIQNVYGNTALHETATTNNITIAKLLLNKDPNLLNKPNKRGETPLFRAAFFGKTEMFSFLLSEIQPNQIKSHLLSYDTSLLHLAIQSECFDIVLLLLKRPDVDPYDKDLTEKGGLTCLQVLANMPKVFMSGHPTSMGLFAKHVYHYVEYSYSNSENKDEYKAKNDEHARKNQMSDLERDLTTKNVEIKDFKYYDSNSEKKDEYKTKNDEHAIKNQMIDLERGLTTKDVEIKGRSISMIWKFIKKVPTMKKILELQNKQRKVVEITKILVQRDLSWKQSSEPKRTDDSRGLFGFESAKSIPKVETSKINEDTIEIPLIAAAKNGISEIVEAIIEKYPQATEYTNKRCENLYHSVAGHRKKKLLEMLLSQKCSMRTLPTRRLNNKITENGETLWHKAAYTGRFSSVRRPGDALFLQSEIQWFKQVRKLLPDHMERNQNDMNLTAEQLFARTHKEVIGNGQKWLSRTTEACSIVAVLIATVAYTCAYTVPGGTDRRTGKPVLLQKTAFTIFTLADTISLFLALTSVVFFLSILTSKMQEQEFWLSLPLKLVCGFTTLFFAVTSMMVAFASTLVLTIQHRLQWATIPVYIIAALPVTVFLVLQFGLYLNIAWFSIEDLLWSLNSYLPRVNKSATTDKDD